MARSPTARAAMPIAGCGERGGVAGMKLVFGVPD
jgi:hypothetical protein